MRGLYSPNGKFFARNLFDPTKIVCRLLNSPADPEGRPDAWGARLQGQNFAGRPRYSSFQTLFGGPDTVGPNAYMAPGEMKNAPNPEAEADCIRRILAGEKQLFHELIRPCERPIYFLLFSIVRNEAEAEDAAQETVLKIYRNLHLFRGESQFRTWALSIARNEGPGPAAQGRNAARRLA